MPAGEVVEIRILDCVLAGDNRETPTVSGYFDDRSKLIAALESVRKERRAFTSPSTPSSRLYWLGPQTVFAESVKARHSDSDVVSRCWLPIDTDATRPAGISATDAEHDAAIERGRALAHHLSAAGWPSQSSATAATAGTCSIAWISGRRWRPGSAMPGRRSPSGRRMPTVWRKLIRRCSTRLESGSCTALSFARGTTPQTGHTGWRSCWTCRMVLRSYPPAARWLAAEARSPRRSRFLHRSMAMPADSTSIALFLTLARRQRADALEGYWANLGFDAIAVVRSPRRPMLCRPATQRRIVAGCHHQSCKGRWGWQRLRGDSSRGRNATATIATANSRRIHLPRGKKRTTNKTNCPSRSTFGNSSRTTRGCMNQSLTDFSDVADRQRHRPRQGR